MYIEFRNSKLKINPSLPIMFTINHYKVKQIIFNTYWF